MGMTTRLPSLKPWATRAGIPLKNEGIPAFAKGNAWGFQ